MALLPTSAIPSGASSYSIDNSCRFQDSKLRMDLGYANDTKWTTSFWFKPSTFDDYILGSWANPAWATIGLNYGRFQLLISGTQNYGNANCHLRTERKLQDPSAWYHIVIVWDTTQSTASNRIKFYINGEKETVFDDAVWPAQNSWSFINYGTTGMIGRHRYFDYVGGDEYYSGYIAEFRWLSGIAKSDASEFGEFGDYGEWKPIEYTGSYGSNGYFLDFKDSSNLGNDVSGNNLDFTITNLAATDQMLDSPTSNFCTWNSEADVADNSYSEGNTKVNTTRYNYDRVIGTMGVSSGKWYWEVLQHNTCGYALIGVTQTVSIAPLQYLGSASDDYAYYQNGNTYNNGSSTSYGSSWSANGGHIIGVALDLDNGTITFYKNNTSQGQAYSGLDGTFMPSLSDWHGSCSGQFIANFGQDSSFAANKTAQNNGEAGDDFYYTPPTGYKSLKASNLPDPAVKPRENFDVAIWTGADGTQTINGLEFQPDFTWIKNRTGQHHMLFDSVRGFGSGYAHGLYTPYTQVEDVWDVGAYGAVTSFNSDGFTLGTSNGYSHHTNKLNETFVGWNWKAGGTAVSNTDGTITSTVSANVAGGFSIVSYTGNGNDNQTLGHGLEKAPEMIMLKERQDNPAGWYVYHSGMATDPETDYMYLNTNATKYDNANIWEDTAPTSSVFTIGSSASVNGNTDTYIAYCFHSVEGHSKVGSYLGNGRTDGTFINCGFKPKYVMIKSTNYSSRSWNIMDEERGGVNPSKQVLYANSSGGEDTYSIRMDVLSNGFKIRHATDTEVNRDGYTYIFIAFADVPFKYSNGN